MAKKTPKVVYRVPPIVSAERLFDAYEIPKKGDEFDYEEIAKIINEPYSPGPCHWYRITKYWRRKLLKEYGVVVKPKNPFGSKKFYCLNDAETVNHVGERWNRIEEIRKKAQTEIKTVDPDKLTPKEKYRLNIEIIKFYHIEAATKRKFTMKEAARIARESTKTVNTRPMIVPVFLPEKSKI